MAHSTRNSMDSAFFRCRRLISRFIARQSLLKTRPTTVSSLQSLKSAQTASLSPEIFRLPNVLGHRSNDLGRTSTVVPSFVLPFLCRPLSPLLPRICYRAHLLHLVLAFRAFQHRRRMFLNKLSWFVRNFLPSLGSCWHRLLPGNTSTLVTCQCTAGRS